MSSNFTLDFPLKSSENTLVYITPIKGNTVNETAINNALFNGWEYEKYIQVNGYTATDDLWTIVGFNDNDPTVKYNNVKILITNLNSNSEQWIECIEYLNQFAVTIPASMTIE